MSLRGCRRRRYDTYGNVEAGVTGRFDSICSKTALPTGEQSAGRLHGSSDPCYGLTRMKPTYVVYSVVLIVLRTLSAGATEVKPPSDEAAPHPTVTDLLEKYLYTDDVKQRAELVGDIEKGANGSVETVVEALTHVKFGAALPGPDLMFPVSLSANESAVASCVLPQNYRPSSPHPLLLWMPDDSTPRKHQWLLSAQRLLQDDYSVAGPNIENFVLLQIEKPDNARSLARLWSDTGLARRVLREARKRIHLDTDRIYLLGNGAGGESAWSVALHSPDLFAGMITTDSFPRLPYPAQVYPFLLGNLQRLPVASTWAGDSTTDGESQDSGERLIKAIRPAALHNRAVVETARKLSLDITGIEWNARDQGAAAKDKVQSTLSRVLAERCGSVNAPVSHWFRYPEHGEARWLRQTSFAGEVWEGDQLSILTTADTDRDRFIAGVIQDKLAFLGGRIEGQTITIEARRCAEIDLLLYEGSIDWGRPVVVMCNGKQRYSGMVRPSMKTLLEAAYTDWDFQHPLLAKLPLSIKD